MKKLLFILVLIWSDISYAQISFDWLNGYESLPNFYTSGYAEHVEVASDRTVWATVSMSNNIILGNDTIIGCVQNESSLFRFDSTGQVLWTFHPCAVSATQLILDHNDNVILIGSTINGQSTDLDPDTGSFIIPGTTNSNFLVAKYSPDGSFNWAFRLNSPSVISISGVAIDASNCIYICGSYSVGANLDLDPGPGIAALNLSGTRAFFIAKYSSNGSFIRAIGVENYSQWGGLATSALITDENNNVFVGGYIPDGVTDFDGNGSNSEARADVPPTLNYGYIASYDSSLNFKWLRVLKADDECDVTSLTTQFGYDLFATGSHSGNMSFDVDATTWDLSDGNTFLAVIDRSDGSVRQGLGLGTTWNPLSCQLNPTGTLLVCGSYCVGDFDPGPDQYLVSSEFFAGLYSISGRFLDGMVVSGVSPGQQTYHSDLCWDGSSSFYVSGRSPNNISDYDPSSASAATSCADGCPFVARYNYTRTFATEGDDSFPLIYPNPFLNELTIEIGMEPGIYTVLFMNVLGQEVIPSVSFHTDAVGEWITLSMPDHLASGVYVLEIQCGDRVWRKSIVRNVQ